MHGKAVNITQGDKYLFGSHVSEAGKKQQELIEAYKRRSMAQTIEMCKASGLPIDGEFEPCAADVERERRYLEKQERHDYIDRHREV